MAAFTEGEVEKIVLADRADGRKKLAKKLKLKEYNEENDLKAAIFIDFLYDNLMFSAGKGFSWSQICYVVKFAQDFLFECQGIPLPGAVRCFKDKSEGLAEVLGERNYKVYTEYIFSTFLSHYQLFTYVFTQPREAHVPNVALDVHVPAPPDELPRGKEEHIWKYEKKIEEVSEMERQKREERLMKKETTVDEKPGQEAVEEKLISAEAPFTKESLSELIKDVLHTYATTVTSDLTSKIKDSGEELDMMLKKTSVPRPQELGPPPRHKLKSPITGNGKSANKNKANKARDSGRSSRNNRSPKAAKSKT